MALTDLAGLLYAVDSIQHGWPCWYWRGVLSECLQCSPDECSMQDPVEGSHCCRIHSASPAAMHQYSSHQTTHLIVCRTYHLHTVHQTLRGSQQAMKYPLIKETIKVYCWSIVDALFPCTSSTASGGLA